LLPKLGDQNDNPETLFRNFAKQNEKRGGHNKQHIVMTVNTFKRLCMKAATSRSNEIHQYYIKMENTYMEFIKYRYNEMKNNEYNMQRQLSIATEKAEYERHNVLANTHKNDKLVYLMKIKDYDDTHMIIKIGKSNCVKQRLEKLRTEFKCKPVLMEVFICDNPECSNDPCTRT